MTNDHPELLEEEPYLTFTASVPLTRTALQTSPDGGGRIVLDFGEDDWIKLATAVKKLQTCAAFVALWLLPSTPNFGAKMGGARAGAGRKPTNGQPRDDDGRWVDEETGEIGDEA